jgi:hypothetical protein
MVALGCATVVLMIRGVCLGARNLRKRGASIWTRARKGIGWNTVPKPIRYSRSTFPWNVLFGQVTSV